MALLLAAPFLCACATLVGGGIGALSDSRKPDYELASRSDLPALRKGTRVVVTDRDGNLHRGRYEGVRTGSDELFATAYERWRITLPDSLRPWPPRAGRRLIVQRHTDGESDTLQGLLMSFDRDTVVFRTDRGSVPAAWAAVDSWTDTEGMPYPLPFAVAPPERQPPFVESIQLYDTYSQVTATIAWSSIETVGVRPSKHGLRNGVLIGAVIDVVWIMITVIAMEDFMASPLGGLRVSDRP